MSGERGGVLARIEAVWGKDSPEYAAVADLVEALAELSGWVERAIVPTYTARKPMPENCRKALDRSHAAIARVTGAAP